MVSQRFGVHIDLGKNQLQNAVIQPLASAPASPVEGQIYFDSSMHQFGVYQNGQWVYLGVSGTDTEAVQDIVAALLTPGSIITATYDDPNNTLTLGIAAGVITNAMVSSSAAISADKLADGTAKVVMTTAERSKLSNIAPNATAYTDTNARANRLDQFAAPTAAVSFNSQNITNLLDPTSAQQAATKNYVDTTTGTASTADRNRANHTGTQVAATISDFDTQVRTSRLDQMAAPTAAVSLNNQRLAAVATPTSGSDAATKDYVDAARQGVSVKDPVLVKTTGNISLSGEQTIDTVTTSSSRVLVASQTNAAQNGIYVSSTGAWSRASDADVSSELPNGALVFVQQGATQGGSRWVHTTTGAITLGTTALVFTQDFAATVTTAGAGLTAAGNAFNIGQGNGISVSADAIAIDASIVVQKKIFTIGDGTATSFTLTHNLNTQDVVVSIRDTTTNELINGSEVATSVNVVTVAFNSAPANGAYKVVVHG
jgi:hypothetical protein